MERVIAFLCVAFMLFVCLRMASADEPRSLGLCSLDVAGRASTWIVAASSGSVPADAESPPPGRRDAKRILTAQERIDRISAIPREYGTPPYGEKDRVHISGVARTWDGKPVSHPVFAAVRCDSTDNRYGWSTGLKTTIQGPNSEQVQFSGLAEHGLLFVRASGYGCQYRPDIRAGEKDVVLRLGSRKIIRGRVTGDLSLLPKDAEGRPFVDVDSRYDFFDFWGRIGPFQRAFVTVREGVGYFQIDDPWGRIVYLSTGGEGVSVRPEQDPLDDVVIELVRPVLRPVVLRLQVPPGAPPVRGNVWVSYRSERDRQRGRSGTSKYLDIEDGAVRCEVPVPGWFGYNINNRFGNDKGPIGYWFPEVRSMSIAAGPDPCLIEVAVRPAGAIYGKILGPDGKVAAMAREMLFLKNPEILERGPSQFLGHALNDMPASMDWGQQRGTFKVTPLPLGGDYIVVACENNRYTASRVVHLDEEQPVAEINLQLLQGVKVTGQLLDAEDHPVRIRVGLFGRPAASLLNDSGWLGSEADPDENGRFVFENVSPGPTGVCGFSVWPRAKYQPVVQKIEDLGSPVTIRLQRGLRLRGTVLDNVTGWPVPNVMLQVFSAPEADNDAYDRFPRRLLPEGPTNERGEFVFSNLSPGRYEVRCFNATFADGQQTVLVTAGQSEPVILRITIPKGRDLQPRKPQAERP